MPLHLPTFGLCHWTQTLSIVLLCAGGFVKSGLALTATASQSSESASANARFFRNPDTEIEVDSAGKGRLGIHQAYPSMARATFTNSSLPAALEARDAGSAVGPQIQNGDFEQGSTTANFQFAKQVPGWSKIGDGAMFIKSGSADFDEIKASRGNYLMGFSGIGSGVFQSVGGHVVGNWYRLIFHSAYSAKKGEAKLKVSVDATEKFNEAVKSGTLGWYEITYQAPYADVVITLEHSGPSGDHAVFIDEINIKPVKMWDVKQGNSHTVLFQKVTCNGYPSDKTCTRGRFLSVGPYGADGKTRVIETNAATDSAVWVALHQGTRWSFKSHSLNQPSPGSTSGPQRTGDIWYLHGDYTNCEARNWFSRATSTFAIEMNALNLHEVSDVGTECGTLFAIQAIDNSDTA